MEPRLSGLDYLFLLIYLIGTMLLGLYVGRKLKTGKDLFIAGKTLPWWAIGMSLVATDIGGTDIIGVGGAAYRYGLAVANFEWIGCVPAMLIAAFLFVPFLWRSGITTIPELMEKRFNVTVRTMLAACWLTFMACNLGIMLLASAKLMSVLLGWNPLLSMVITAILVGIYTVVGGLAAVVYTDVVQCVVMIAGCLLVLVIGLYEIGGPAQLQQELARLEQSDQVTPIEMPAGNTEELTSTEKMRLILPVDTGTPFPWTGIVFGLMLILSPAYWIGNQAIVQRSLGAKSAFDAQKAYVLGAILKNLIPIIIAVPGLIALVKFPDLSDGDFAFPSLVAELLPMGLKGIFLAAFLAALMSSIDSYLNSAAALLTNDFYLRFINPQANDRRQLQIGRVVTLILLIWAFLFALWLTQIEAGVYAIFQTLMSFFQGPALALLLTGLLWKRATGTGAACGFLAGVITAVGLFAMNQPAICQTFGWEPLFRVSEPFLYFSIWAFLVSMLVIACVSWITPQDSAEKTAMVIWQRESSPS